MLIQTADLFYISSVLLPLEPRVYFAQSDYSVKENVGNVTILLEREGDLRHHTYVRCYTRQMSARVNEDFIERRNTNVSFVKFERKEHQAKCQVRKCYKIKVYEDLSRD